MVIYGYNKGFSSDARLILAFASSAVLVVVEVLHEKKHYPQKFWTSRTHIFYTPNKFLNRFIPKTKHPLKKGWIFHYHWCSKFCWGCRKFRFAKFNSIIFFCIRLIVQHYGNITTTTTKYCISDHDVQSFVI